MPLLLNTTGMSETKVNRMTKRQVTQLSYEIAGYAIKVHKSLGPGLLESVYEKCLKYELVRNGYEVKQQLLGDVVYEGIEIDTELRQDLLVNVVWL